MVVPRSRCSRLVLAAAGAFCATVLGRSAAGFAAFSSSARLPVQRRPLRCCAASGRLQDTGVAMRYKVTLETPDGDKSFECPPDVTILDKAQQEGLVLPYSCRAGACSSCTGKVSSGLIDQSTQAYLDEDQVAAGYCLTCVSYPRSDVRIVTHKEHESDTYVPVHVDGNQEFIHVGSASSTGVRFRQNFAETSEAALNSQIQMELTASHMYLAMAAYFGRADVALPGFKEWSEKQSKEEREHADQLIEYLNIRGGAYTPLPIAAPDRAEWGSAINAMEYSLRVEMQVNKALLRLHKTAADAADPQMCDFLESNFLTEQVESINKIAKVIRKLIRAGPGLGEYTVDREMNA